MADRRLHVVTGAFGYSGRYIAERLLRAATELGRRRDRRVAYADAR
jgi:short subunit dehydrogenase-like uncharacterized protein